MRHRRWTRAFGIHMFAKFRPPAPARNAQALNGPESSQSPSLVGIKLVGTPTLRKALRT